MKAFIELLKQTVGVHKGMYIWESGKGLTVSEPSNFDLGTELVDMAAALNLKLRVNPTPQPNPKTGGFFPPSISISKVAEPSDEEIAAVLS